MLAAGLVLGGCATPPPKDLGLAQTRSALQDLRQDGDLGGLAPDEAERAERALERAEQAPASEPALREHWALMAERRVQIARAVAERRHAEERTEDLRETLTELRIEAREVAARQARREAERARVEAMIRAEAAAQAERQAQRAESEKQQARREAQQAREQAQAAQQEARQARRVAEAEAREAELARQEAKAAAATAEVLKEQLRNLQARQTGRGLVMTLQDLLFETGEAELKQTALENLDRLVKFLRDHPESPVRIEGHTDSRGSAQFNQKLSQQRAQQVKQALVQRGIDASRIEAIGLGEAYPIASNDSPEGRRRNRRVDVVVTDVAPEENPATEAGDQGTASPAAGTADNG